MRSRKTKDTWIQLIESYRSSNLTQREFCRRESISFSTFKNWMYKLKKEPTQPTWEKLELTHETNTLPRITLETKNIKVHIHQAIDKSAMHDLLTMLKSL